MMRKTLLMGLTMVFFLSAAVAFIRMRPNKPFPQPYPVRGVDVSAYQGEINWDLLSKQKIDFAFIKATEGSGHQDARFFENWNDAAKTPLRVGAYHFFSFESGGAGQAANFMRTVSAELPPRALPPAVDIELYGDNKLSPPKREGVRRELDALLLLLEEHYGSRPLLYATESSYRLYLAEGYEEYDIWIRNVRWTPRLSRSRGWTFWQYSDRGLLPGMRGEEKYVDLNVFNGSREEFLSYRLAGE